MDKQPVRRVGRLANTGCALGALSWGFIAAALIYPFVTTIDRHGLEALAIGFTVFFIAIGGWLLGFVGSIISLIALRRIMRGSGENASKGIAILGLVLGSLGVAIVCVLLAYILLFNSSTPPPVMITPSSIIPLPTGG